MKSFVPGFSLVRAVVLAVVMVGCGSHPGSSDDASVADGGTDAMTTADAAPADPSTHDPALVGRWSTSLTSPEDPMSTMVVVLEFDANGSYSELSTVTFAPTDTTQPGCQGVANATGGTWSTAPSGGLAATPLTQSTQSTTGCVRASDDRAPTTSASQLSVLPAGATYAIVGTRLTVTVPQSGFSVVLVFDRVN